MVDSSHLIAVFDSTDPRHVRARQEFEEASPAIIPTEILVETLGVLKVKIGRKAAANTFEKLLRLANVTWSECCDFQGAVALYRSSSALSFPDAIVVRECITRSAHVLSFDERQQRAIAKG